MSSPVIALARHLLTARSRSGTTATMLAGADMQGVLDIRLVGATPEDELVGWRAPPGWDAALLLTTASVAAADAGGGGGGGGGDAARQVAVVADRGHPPQVVAEDTVLHCEPCPLTDALQRITNRTTAPPRLSVAALAAAVWFHRLADLVADHPHPWELRWSELARRHPGAPMLGAATRAEFDRLHEAMRGPEAWQGLAMWLTESALSVGPARVSWFDAGSYERWLLGRLREPADAVGDLAGWLSVEMGEAVAAVADQVR